MKVKNDHRISNCLNGKFTAMIILHFQNLVYLNFHQFFSVTFLPRYRWMQQRQPLLPPKCNFFKYGWTLQLQMPARIHRKWSPMSWYSNLFLYYGSVDWSSISCDQRERVATGDKLRDEILRQVTEIQALNNNFSPKSEHELTPSGRLVQHITASISDACGKISVRF